MTVGFYGCYRAVCTTNADPENRRRIKVQVPQVIGSGETDWAWPCLAPSVAYSEPASAVDGGGILPASADIEAAPVPAPGQGVWVMFEAGDIEKPVWVGVWQ